MSTTAALLSRYKTVQVTTSSPEQLVVMLHDGVFRFIREARDAHESGDRVRFAERLHRVHAIIELLQSSLSREAQPDLCEKLEGVYVFCLTNVVTASLSKTTEPLLEIERVLEPLRDAWRAILTAPPDKRE